MSGSAEEKKDAGVGVKKGMNQDGRNQAAGAPVNSGQESPEDREGNQGGAMEMDGSKGQGGKPLGLGDRHAPREPGKQGAPKKNLLPNRCDHQRIDQKGKNLTEILGFEKFQQGRLRFQGKSQRQVNPGAEQKEQKNRPKKGEKQPQAVPQITKFTPQSPKNEGMRSGQRREEKAGGQASSRKQGGRHYAGGCEQGDSGDHGPWTKVHGAIHRKGDWLEQVLQAWPPAGEQTEKGAPEDQSDVEEKQG